MTNRFRSLMLAGALLSSASAFASGTGTAPKPATSEAPKSGVMIPADEQAFLERLHAVNQQEIKLGNIAKEKASMPQTKEFGQHMVTAHTKADQDLMAYAKQKKITLDEPKPMNDVEEKAMDADKAKADELKALQGQAFDSAYLSAMVGGHDMVLAQLIAADKQFKGAGSAPMINKLIPEVKQHRTEAYRLLGQTVPKT